MKFSNMLFPYSETPDGDFTVVNEALREVELSEQLGFDAVWLSEHHFGGVTAYADPLSFASAIAARTHRIRIGFAVLQMALHHPVRLAEQIAVIDNISQGRIIVGIGRGSVFNIYEYRGFGVAFEEAKERLVEAEDLMIKSWTSPMTKHRGKFWSLDLPAIRPMVYQKPHPLVIRGCHSLESTLEMARRGRPFLMSPMPADVIRERFEKYRQTMAEVGYDDEAIEKSVEQSWAWCYIVVAETDAKAEAIRTPAIQSMLHLGRSDHERLATPDELARIPAEEGTSVVEKGVHIYGSPSTVCERLVELQKIGIGGLMIQFRQGSMSWEANENSLRLFAEKVAPEFRSTVGKRRF